MKRENYISWDEYFMAIAKISAERSKDPNTNVGTCIVDKNHRIISIGYNGMPNGINDDVLPWGKEGTPSNTKYPYVCHAEENAIMNAKTREFHGCTVYTTLFPCNECAKILIQSGIEKVIYASDKYHDTELAMVARKLFDLAGIKYEPYKETGKEVVVNL